MLANPIRGQVGFIVHGKGWTLSFSVNALVALEAEMGLSVREIAKRLNSPEIGVGELRQIFVAGLQDHQPKATAEDAGVLMGEIGIQKASSLIGDTFLAAFPGTEEVDAAANPRRGAGTGSRSLKRGAKPGSTPNSSGASLPD